MLDIKLIRDNPEQVKEQLATVGVPGADVDALLDVDRVRRASMGEVEALRAERTKRSKEIQKISDPDERDKAVRPMRALGEQVSQLEKQLAQQEEDFQQRLLELPNLPHPDVPGWERRRRKHYYPNGGRTAGLLVFTSPALGTWRSLRNY